MGFSSMTLLLLLLPLLLLSSFELLCDGDDVPSQRREIEKRNERIPTIVFLFMFLNFRL